MSNTRTKSCTFCGAPTEGEVFVSWTTLGATYAHGFAMCPFCVGSWQSELPAGSVASRRDPVVNFAEMLLGSINDGLPGDQTTVDTQEGPVSDSPDKRVRVAVEVRDGAVESVLCSHDFTSEIVDHDDEGTPCDIKAVEEWVEEVDGTIFRG